VNRRELLLDGLRFLACAPLSAVPNLALPQSAPGSNVLKSAGARFGRQIGISADKNALQDASFARVVSENFNLLTASGMKWDRIHPELDRYDFAEGDWSVQFAEQNGMQVHGHNLCWNAPFAYPAWFKTELHPSNAKQILTDHITTVVKHYAGRVASWDVVNESLVPWSKHPDLLYPGVWTDYLGPSYFDIAFHATAAADPNALRIFNIYRVEQGTDDDVKTRAATIALLKQLLARGVPIQAIGIESHLDDSQPLGGPAFHQFLADLRAMNLQVVITELDVKENRVGTSLEWDQTTAKYYGDYLTDFISVCNPPFVIFWSLKDRWENGKRVQGLMQNNLSPRLNYYAALKVLEQPITG
jgi:endo-1,4-beta-xylanase